MIGTAKTALHLGASIGEASGLLGLLERIGGSRPGGVHVLMYHRVAEPGDDPALYPGLVSATPSEFERQMAALRERHRVISTPELLGSLASGNPLPPRAVLLTFDDAYQDFADHAWPTLKRYDLPATLFVPTAFPGGMSKGFWWDRLHAAVCSAEEPRDLLSVAGASCGPPISKLDAYRRLRDRVSTLPHGEGMGLVEALCAAAEAPDAGQSVLRWDELRTLAREGLTLAAHTRTHPLLDRVPPEVMRREISGAREDLCREIGQTQPVFAYPGGSCPDEAVRILREEGFAAAFTTQRGVADLRHHGSLLLPRIPVTRSTTSPILRAQLLEQFAHLNRAWRR